MKNNKRVVATIEARIGSTRLPGKVLMPLAGKPVLQQIFERMSCSKLIDEVCIATTTNPLDDAIEEFSKQKGYKYFRGSEDNVLSRVLEASALCNADVIVEGMGDSPMVDWSHIDYIVDMLVENNYDFVSNEIGDTFPLGFDIRAFSFSALKESQALATDPEHHEHVGLYISSHPEKYKIGVWNAEGKMNWPDLRLTLDTSEDYELISKVYESLSVVNPFFTAEDVVDFLIDKPEMYNINSSIKQKIPYQEESGD